jgi:predicted DNA-binding transcriptional regulator AlpA
MLNATERSEPTSPEATDDVQMSRSRIPLEKRASSNREVAADSSIDAVPIRFLRPEQVETLYGLSRRFLAHARVRGDGPPYCKPSPKLVLYSVEELEAWLARYRRVSTCDRYPEK